VGRTLLALGIQRPASTSRSVEAAVLGGGDVAQVRDLPPGVAQAFGINVDTEAVSRREAMSIPAMRRGRNVIAGTISSFPLVAARIPLGEDGRTAPTSGDRVPVRRSLLEQPDPRLTASQWKLRLVDDLLFYPWSFCRVTARDVNRFPMQLEHIERPRLRIDYTTQQVFVDNVEVDPRDMVRFDGPDEGVLRHGAMTLRTALALEAAVRRYANLDVPLGVLRDESQATATGRDKLNETSVETILNKWEEGARRRVTRYIGRLKYEPVQLDAARIQLNQARERSDVAIAQMLNLESQQVNAPGETGMTYTNRESIAASKVDALRPYMDAITERLSMPDITPRGQVVTFDTTRYLRGTTKEVLDAAAVATGGKPLMSPDEARVRFLDLPPGAPADAPAPAPEDPDA
jgi:hypothetical protein